MSGPGYAWTCKRCESANQAHVDECASCGCPAVISPAALELPREQSKRGHFLSEPGAWGLMLPEMPIAAVLVLAAPLWAMSLFVNQRPFAALFLLIAAGGLGYMAYRAIRANEKWGAYASIIGILMVGVLVASSK